MVFKSCGLYQTLISGENSSKTISTTEEIAKTFNTFDTQKQTEFLKLIFEHYKVTDVLSDGDWKQHIYQDGKDVEIKLGEILNEDEVLKGVLSRFCEVCKTE